MSFFQASHDFVVCYAILFVLEGRILKTCRSKYTYALKRLVNMSHVTGNNNSKTGNYLEYVNDLCISLNRVNIICEHQVYELLVPRTKLTVGQGQRSFCDTEFWWLKSRRNKNEISMKARNKDILGLKGFIREKIRWHVFDLPGDC